MLKVMLGEAVPALYGLIPQQPLGPSLLHRHSMHKNKVLLDFCRLLKENTRILP